MNPYTEGKIYKLFASGDETKCYIGSTCSELQIRLNKHKYAAASAKCNQSASSVLFENNATVLIELLEAVNCTTKEELELRERHWIENTPTAVNKNIPTRTHAERHVLNRDHNLEQHRKWLQENKEQQAQYRADNAAHIKAAEKERYDKGYKEKRNAAKKEKVKCDICQKEMNKNSLWTHKNTVHKV